MMFTSDQEFFDKIGEEETRRYFEECYKFVCNYKKLGEQYFLSAKVHMDEQTPHMHLQRGVPIEETNRKHYSVEEYKKITNFKQTKKTLENIKLELPDVPEIADINVARWSKKERKRF